jgi:hypothetical protein
VPVVYREYAHASEFLAAGMLPESVVMSQRPPLLSDCFNTAFARDISVPAGKKIISIQAAQFYTGL